MTDFNSFRNAVLEDDDLQEQVISIINTATANGSGMGDGIATLAKTHGFTITSEEVYAHQDFLGRGFYVKQILNPVHPSTNPVFSFFS